MYPFIRLSQNHAVLAQVAAYDTPRQVTMTLDHTLTGEKGNLSYW